MSNELIAAVISFVVTLTGLAKLYTDLLKVKKDREEVKLQRDSDSSELHDQCQKNTWDLGRAREDIMMLKTHMDDHQIQISTINTELAKVSTKIDTVLDAINKLSEKRS